MEPQTLNSHNPFKNFNQK